MVFFAHSTSKEDRSDWQLLSEHLTSVGAQCADRARTFGAQDLAHVAGLLHDLGKYTDDFQRRIAGDAIRVDHATRGAMVAVERFGPIGMLVAYGIAGHHAGLANGSEGSERTALRDRLKGLGLPPLKDDWRRDITLPEQVTLPKLVPQKDQDMFQFAFFARMLFSCLVDADYLDTEAFYDRVALPGQPNDRSATRALEAPSLQALRERLDIYLSGFAADSDVNRVRTDILAHTRQAALHAPGLFSLTVPTGGGKTLASLAFALDHAIEHGLRRVIFVIPFTSIVEQNAAVFRSALGDLGEAAVLEHHSAFVAAPLPRSDAERYQAREKLRLAMENWDAPIIVTTAVQFFESLFAARPSQCRKLHNIAGSVVILDELARNYRSSIVLCTATQPALNAPDFRGGLEKVRELAPNPPELFRKLDRVRVRHVGTLDDDALAAQLLELDQVLCIVNNRRHAHALYQALAGRPGARHLTTLMCAKHRSEVLAEVRVRLKAGEPCRLISTSLIEAGVDISLPTVYRLLYWQKGDKELDAANLLSLCAASRIDSLPMETLAAKFRMIDTVQMPVIVPFDDDARRGIESLRYAERSGGLARALQPYLVQLPRDKFDALRKMGAVQPVAPEKWGEQFMELVNEDLYNPHFGLSWDDPAFVKTESLMW